MVSLAVLWLAPAADAGQRFAAPGGTGAECTQEEPCALSEAVAGAKAGDEVILGAGTYSVSSPISAPSVTNVQIHGDTGGPMPRVAGAFPGPVFNLFETGDSLSYVEIENDANGGGAVGCLGSRLERIRVRVVGLEATGVFTDSDCAIRNSLLRVEGAPSIGLRANGASPSNTSASAKNVTVISSGSNSIGATAEYNIGSAGSFTLELENAILQGTEDDLKAMEGAKGLGNIAVNHSNFDTFTAVGGANVIDGGGNQTAPPVYVDAEAGDFREAAGSPTIDAGIAGELGQLDLSGNTRVLGPAPDIGAFEFVPPPSPAPGQIQSLAIAPRAFRTTKGGGAVTSAGRKAKGHLGATVTYGMSASGEVKFTVEKLSAGRRVGKQCVKQTRTNASHKKCTLSKPVRGGFTLSGVAGQNSFKFSGRIGGRALRPGRYRLKGSTGATSRLAGFKITN
jgi:hypothetical protein